MNHLHKTKKRLKFNEYVPEWFTGTIEIYDGVKPFAKIDAEDYPETPATLILARVLHKYLDALDEERRISMVNDTDIIQRIVMLEQSKQFSYEVVRKSTKWFKMILNWFKAKKLSDGE